MQFGSDSHLWCSVPSAHSPHPDSDIRRNGCGRSRVRRHAVGSITREVRSDRVRCVISSAKALICPCKAAES
jgi:hypothetical protein